MADLAEKIERYRAKIKFQHTFYNVNHLFDIYVKIPAPEFFARNIPFCLELSRRDRLILCDLSHSSLPDGVVSFNVKFHYSLISYPKTKSEEFSYTFKPGMSSHRTILSDIFPHQEITVDDAIALKVSLSVEDPEGIEFKPLKDKLRQDLQIEGNQVQRDAFASLLDSGNFSDVTFVTNEDSFKVKAHKAILASRSDVFDRMLTSDMKEAMNNEIRIDDMGSPALKIMLHHIYTGQLLFPKGIEMDLEICQELANAGEKYNLKNLKEYAAMAMTEFVSLDNAWELLLFAKRLKAEAATKIFTLYCGKNVYEIIEKL